jgi:hypothetical protein
MAETHALMVAQKHSLGPPSKTKILLVQTYTILIVISALLAALSLSGGKPIRWIDYVTSQNGTSVYQQ